MWDEPDDFGVPGHMFGGVPEDFIRAVGRVAMIAPLIENLFAHVVAKVGQLDSSLVAAWPAGRLTEKFDQIADTRELDPRLIAAAEEMTSLANIRNALVHSSWPFHGGGVPRGWRYLPARRARAGSESVASTEVSLEDLRHVIQRMLALHGELRELLSTLDVQW